MPLCKIVLALLGLLLLVQSQEPDSKSIVSEDLAKLSWMAGEWELKEGAETTVEQWRPLEGSMMLGVSHTFDAKETRSFEFLSISARDGKITYWAQPGGGRGARFDAVKVTERDVIFENALHGHPQVIRYERTEKGMTATISMMDGSKATRYAYERRAK